MSDNLGTIHGNDPHATGGVVVVFVAELVGEGFVEECTDGMVLGGGELVVG
jgi:hypothetical protein